MATTDTPSPKEAAPLPTFWIFAKAALFLVIAALTAGMILLQTQNLRTALLLALCTWSCCRLYYFAFYVIERYVDPTFRFSSLTDLTRYLWRKHRR